MVENVLNSSRFARPARGMTHLLGADRDYERGRVQSAGASALDSVSYVRAVEHGDAPGEMPVRKVRAEAARRGQRIRGAIDRDPVMIVSPCERPRL